MQEMDVFLTIGCDCRPVFYMRESELTWFTSPLDWYRFYNLNTFLKLYENQFSGFFENIKELETSDKTASDLFRKVYDLKYDIKSLHHFHNKLTLRNGQLYVRSKAMKRYRETDAALREAKRIGLIGNWAVPEEELISFLKKFGEMYPHREIMLYNIHHVADADGLQKKETQISRELGLVEFFFCDEGNGATDSWKGNCGFWKKVMSELCLSPESQKRREEVCQKY